MCRYFRAASEHPNRQGGEAATSAQACNDPPSKARDGPAAGRAPRCCSGPCRRPRATVAKRRNRLEFAADQGVVDALRGPEVRRKGRASPGSKAGRHQRHGVPRRGIRIRLLDRQRGGKPPKATTRRKVARASPSDQAPLRVRSPREVIAIQAAPASNRGKATRRIIHAGPKPVASASLRGAIPPAAAGRHGSRQPAETRTGSVRRGAPSGPETA